KKGRSVSRRRKKISPGRGVALAADGAAEPRPGEAPLPVRRRAGHAEGLRGLVDGQPGVEMELNDLRRLGVFRGQTGESLIQRDDLVGGWSNRHVLAFQIDPLEFAAVLDRLLPP